MNLKLPMIFFILLLLAQPSFAWYRQDWSQVAEPPKDEIDIISQTSGSVYISLKSSECYDSDAREFTIASYYGDYVYHGKVSVQGKADVRVPTGLTYIVLFKGGGSSNDFNTWKKEDITIEVLPGSETTVAFIGSTGNFCWM